MIILISNHKWFVLETKQSIKSFFILVQSHTARQELEKTSKTVNEYQVWTSQPSQAHCVTGFGCFAHFICILKAATQSYG